jgi:hypothetical protein
MVKEAFALLTQTLPPKPLKTLTRAQVVSRKIGTKRHLYQRALESLERQPLVRGDAQVKMFIKNERMSDPSKAPRAIQGRGPRYNLELQTYIMPIEEYIFHRGVNNAVSTKCFDQAEKAQCLRAAWDSFNDPIAILADHSRYDSRIHSVWLQAEHEYYLQFYDGDDYLKLLLNMQSHNTGRTRHGVAYTVKGTRASGDANTSLGNSVINIAILKYWTKGVPARIIVDGDDSVVMMERAAYANVDLLKLQSMGFSTTFNVVDEFEHIDFCQCKPILTKSGWRMVRDPQRVIDRSTVCIDANYQDLPLFKRWLASVGTCEESLNAGVPVLQSFARFLKRFATSTITMRDVDTRYRVLRRPVESDILEHTRRSFSNAFGISPTQQCDLEQYFDSMSVDVHLYDHVAEPSLNTSVVQVNYEVQN